MIISLAATNPTTVLYLSLVPLFFVVGFFLNRVILTFVAKKVSTLPTPMSSCKTLKSVFFFWSYDIIMECKSAHNLCVDGVDEIAMSKVYASYLVDQAYRFMLIEAACLVCLAHGSNDVANSIAPLLVELGLYSLNKSWAYWLGGIGISLGLLTLGYKVMETVGKNVIKLDFYKGFSC